MITQGNWRILKTTDSTWHVYTGDEGNEIILASVHNQDFKSNAHLMATAPELRDALKSAIRRIKTATEWLPEDYPSRFLVARAEAVIEYEQVIAKAKQFD